MATKLTTKIPIKNQNGEVIGEKEVVTYAGLLARAHEEGLEAIETELLQVPNEDNGMAAVVRAVVRGSRGVFSGIGDADPSNVNRAVSKHLIRLAETRAKARALRDLTNIGTVSFEELGGEDDDGYDEAPQNPFRHQTTARNADGGGRDAMTKPQRRMLWRQAMKLGHKGDDASTFLAQRLGVENGQRATKREASRLIDQLEVELQRGGFGDAA